MFTTSLHTVRRVVPQHRDRTVTTDYCEITTLCICLYFLNKDIFYVIVYL